MTRLRAFWEQIRGTYWAVPSAMAAVAAIFAFVMIAVDEGVPSAFISKLSWVYTGGPEGARAVLSTVAASMITVAGVTFSITIVALTLASQQFGPRLLRNFLRDLGNQITLGTFIATFIYCLLVLRTVRGTDDEEFVPHLAVTVGVALAIVGIGVLIFFIHHVATSIQASQMIANVAADLEGAIERLFPEKIGHGLEADAHQSVPPVVPTFAGACRVVADRAGYVQAIDSPRLLSLACDANAVLRIDARPGMFVRAGTPLAVIVPPPEPPDRMDDSLRVAFIIGGERTGTQDVEFFINQLVELGVRALSPGINDPATARACVDRLEQALCQLAGRRIPSPYRLDDEGVLRVVAQPVTFSDVLDVSMTELTRHARASVSVSCRLLAAVRTLSGCVRLPQERMALVRQARAIGERGADPLPNETDRAALDACYRETLAVLNEADGTSPPA